MNEYFQKFKQTFSRTPMDASLCDDTEYDTLYCETYVPIKGYRLVLSLQLIGRVDWLT